MIYDCIRFFSSESDEQRFRPVLIVAVSAASFLLHVAVNPDVLVSIPEGLKDTLFPTVVPQPWLPVVVWNGGYRLDIPQFAEPTP